MYGNALSSIFPSAIVIGKMHTMATFDSFVCVFREHAKTLPAIALKKEIINTTLEKYYDSRVLNSSLQPTYEPEKERQIKNSTKPHNHMLQEPTAQIRGSRLTP